MTRNTAEAHLSALVLRIRPPSGGRVIFLGYGTGERVQSDCRGKLTGGGLLFGRTSSRTPESQVVKGDAMKFLGPQSRQRGSKPVA
jgi:hypothetical protein